MAPSQDRFISTCQLGLSVLFLTGYFTVIILFMLGKAQIPPDFKEAFSGLLSLMTGGGLTILYFWFQRTRAPPESTAPTRAADRQQQQENADAK